MAGVCGNILHPADTYFQKKAPGGFSAGGFSFSVQSCADPAEEDPRRPAGESPHHPHCPYPCTAGSPHTARQVWQVNYHRLRARRRRPIYPSVPTCTRPHHPRPSAPRACGGDFGGGSFRCRGTADAVESSVRLRWKATSTKK